MDTMTQTKSRAEKFWTHPAVVFFIAFFCCFLWGSASPAIKIGYELFTIGAGDLASRFVFAGVRFFLAGMMVIAFGSVQQRRFLHPSKISWKYVFVLMTFQTILQYIFWQLLSSGLRSLQPRKSPAVSRASWASSSS